MATKQQRLTWIHTSVFCNVYKSLTQFVYRPARLEGFSNRSFAQQVEGFRLSILKKGVSPLLYIAWKWLKLSVLTNMNGIVSIFLGSCKYRQSFPKSSNNFCSFSNFSISLQIQQVANVYPSASMYECSFNRFQVKRQ